MVVLYLIMVYLMLIIVLHLMMYLMVVHLMHYILDGCIIVNDGAFNGNGCITFDNNAFDSIFNALNGGAFNGCIAFDDTFNFVFDGYNRFFFLGLAESFDRAP